MSSSFHHVGVQWKLSDLEEGSHQNPTRLALWSCDFWPQHCQQYISTIPKPPSLWYFVLAAWTD